MTLQISIIDDSRQYRWYHWRRKHHRKIIKFLQDTVEPEIKTFSQHDETSDSYPWCFVFSGKTLSRKHYYIGALTITKNNCNKESLCVIFSQLPYNVINLDFKKKFHIAFWQARILAFRQGEMHISKKNSQFSEWIKALQIHYSPFLESFLIRKKFRFINTSESLLSNCHILDNQIPVNGGVELMPWKSWPECIQTGNFVWLWRQSRHGRIIDSKKISVPMDITNARR